MGGRVAGLHAAALVDGDIHDGAARPHQREHLPGDQLRGGGPGDQDRADDQIGLGQGALDVVGVGVQGLHPAVVEVVKPAQAIEADVHDRDIRAQAHRHLHGVEPHDAPADDQHLAREDPRHAAEQHPAAALVLGQAVGPGLHREPPGHLGHRRQQRQGAVSQLDRLVGDAHHPGLEQGLGLHRIRGQVQVGVEDLSPAQQGVLRGEGLLDLPDQIGPGVDLLRRGDDLRAGADVLVIRQAAAGPGALLDQHGVAALGEGLDPAGDEPDAVLLGLDFARHANDHGLLHGGRVRRRT